jgi:hypothetical protein
MSDEPIVVSMSDLIVATTASDTDTFAVCQNPLGCGPSDPLVRMSLAQVKELVLEAMPHQYASDIVTYGNRVTLQTGQLINIASVSLTPGVWLLWGEYWFVVDSGIPMIGRVAAMIAPDTQQSAPTDPADDLSVNVVEINQSKQGGGATTGIVLPLTQLHVDLASPAVYNLTGMITWTGGGSISGYGKIAGLLPPSSGTVLTDDQGRALTDDQGRNLTTP